ncbi:MAG: hypothetical protein A2V98_24640 [Planctomycetes bacterium RBG_16_64_12]|nr:MAG: hypothetical protein A2V98_24640 [Planctomycetes bacterium RBG_16_64_12]
MIAHYWRFAKTCYVKGGRPTDTQDHIRLVLKDLRRTYGHNRAADFGPLALKALQQNMARAGCSRKYINTQMGRLVQVFKWARG